MNVSVSSAMSSSSIGTMIFISVVLMGNTRVWVMLQKSAGGRQAALVTADSANVETRT